MKKLAYLEYRTIAILKNGERRTIAAGSQKNSRALSNFKVRRCRQNRVRVKIRTVGGKYVRRVAGPLETKDGLPRP